MKRARFLILFLIVMQWAGTAYCEGVKVRAGLTLGYDNTRFKFDKTDVPAAAINEGQNPSITNHYSGHAFGAGTIGTFDATDIRAKNSRDASDAYVDLDCDLFLDISGKQTSPYLRVNIPINRVNQSIHGVAGDGYAYAKVLGDGADFVRYIYGAEMKYGIFNPEVGWRWQKQDWRSEEINRTSSISVEFRTRTTKFYKGLEAWGVPDTLIELGQVKQNIAVAHLQYGDSTINYGLTVPLSGTKGIGLTVSFFGK